VKRPIPFVPHLSGLFELEQLADESVALAEQIKAAVAQLRQQDADQHGGTKRDDAD
jgi:hypothetical protein